jgi:undecaprenyl-phosphate 4-deoxy-4-formamido-L-arabinose transferase
VTESLSRSAVPTGLEGVSVVIPCYRSRETLPPLVSRLVAVLRDLAPAHEVILVIDGSPDDTAQVARRLAASIGRSVVRVIELRRNYGQHNALLAGVAAARFDVVVTMDDDLQHRPEQIPALVAPLRDASVDLVYGVPVEEEHGWLRSQASRSVKSALSMAGVPNAQDVSAFRAFRSDLREAFSHVSDPFVSLDVVLSWATTSVRRVPVQMDRRETGRSGYTLRGLVGHALNMATGYSVLPLRLVTWLGLVVSAFGLVAFAAVVYLNWTGRIQVAGFTTVVAMLGLLSGTMMLCLGVIGEYLGRLHVRSMQRPAYLVRPDRMPVPEFDLTSGARPCSCGSVATRLDEQRTS